MTNTSGAPSGAPLGADVRVNYGPGVPKHGVKFRTAGREHQCDSQLCPEKGSIIRAGTKYARVMRPRNGSEYIEVFHPKCYDYEFDQGA